MNRNDAQALMRSHREELRRALDALAALAAKVLAGERQRIGDLLHRARLFHEQLSSHTVVEDRVLAPLLPAGEADQLRRHQRQRKRLLDALSIARDLDVELSDLARNIGALIHVLREEVDQEERSLSSRRLLPPEHEGQPRPLAPRSER